MKILILAFSFTVYLFLTHNALASSPIVINEVLPNPSGLSTELNEWIELYNASAEEVDLSGWLLDDISNGGTSPYTIQDGTKIAGGAFLVFEKSTTRVGLNNSYDMVRLIDRQGSEVDNFEYELAKEDVSFARSPDGSSNWIETSPTKGLPNPKPPDIAIPKKGANNIILSESSPAPTQAQEWVEVYNPNSQSVNVGGWKIDDIEGGSSPFIIPLDTVVDPKSYKVFYFGSKLNNGGDTIRLINPEGKMMESYSYKKVEKGTIFAKDSQGRWRITTTATPGKKNIITSPKTSTAANDNDLASLGSLNSGSYSPGGSVFQGSNPGDTSDFSQILGITAPENQTKDTRPVKTGFADSKKSGQSTPSIILVGIGLIFLGAAFGLPVLQGQPKKILSTNEG